LIDVLEASPPAINLDDLALAAGGTIGLTTQDRFLLASLLKGISSFVADNSDFVATLADWFANKQQPGAPENRLDVEPARLDFIRLLSCEASIGITGKAQDVMWGHGRVFRGAHVVTQIRPVFRKEISVPPDNAVLVHDLRIDYREGQIESSCLVTLDSGRIRELIQVLERALKKEETLRNSATFNVLGTSS
ncbi:MAG: hypothetical protein IAG10_18250, partial [Planctomycetaceae bacterium]|nr:hypothetical protein [Planctomycetaceae bacterium]